MNLTLKIGKIGIPVKTCLDEAEGENNVVDNLLPILKCLRGLFG